MGDVKASNGWLEYFKKRFGLRQTRIVGEAGDIPITTIKAWLERLPENIQGYSADDIWYMQKKCKGGKKSKERLTVAFFGSSSGFKACEPAVIGKSKVPRYFRKLPNPSRPYGMQYFRSKKAYITTEIMIQVLTALDHKLDVEN